MKESDDIHCDNKSNLEYSIFHRYFYYEDLQSNRFLFFLKYTFRECQCLISFLDKLSAKGLKKKKLENMNIKLLVLKIFFYNPMKVLFLVVVIAVAVVCLGK